VRLGVAVADIAAGMFAVQGLLLALIARGSTGHGQLVDVSLLDAVTSLLSYQAGRFFATGEIPTRAGNRHMTIAPYDTYDTREGVVVLAVGNDAQWQRLCEALQLTALAADARFTTNAGRVEHYAELRHALATTFGRLDAGSTVETLRRAGVPCGAVRSIDEVFADAQVLARGMVETVRHPAIGELRVLGLPVKLSGTPGAIRSAPPRLGEHTRSVLQQDLGVGGDEIDALAAAGLASSTSA
jgi:crotonobetainyl-CoA:carnitine CoA-transferase CaiB-like acyl-CoA transferase